MHLLFVKVFIFVFHSLQNKGPMPLQNQLKVVLQYSRTALVYNWPQDHILRESVLCLTILQSWVY